MAKEILELLITAENKKAIDGLKQTAKGLEDVNRAASKSVGGTNQAANALTNLGRVAQDAPFGFIGIQNNLNPLLESFQRLKKETGSTSGALKALGNSLLGPAGIGVAVSVVTSALTFMTMNGFFKTKDAAAEAKKEIDEFNKSLDNAKSGALATGVKLQRFVEIAKDGNLPLKQRNEALKEANKLMGTHGDKLTLANIASAETTKQVNQLTQALIAQALAAKFADRVADLMIKQSDAAKEYGKAKDGVNVLTKSLNDLGTAAKQNRGNLAIVSNATKGLIDKTTAYKTITQELKDVTGQFNTQLTLANTIFSNLGTKEKEQVATKQIHKESIVKLNEEYKKLNAQLVIQNQKYSENIINENTLNKLRPMTLAGINAMNVETDNTNKIFDAQSQLISSSLAPAFESFFTTLMSGGDAFQAFIDSLKQMIAKLISALIAALALQLILSALFPGKAAKGAFDFGKVLSMVGGGGLGGLFKKNAVGGIATRATPGIVGEAGPEAIIPLNRLPEMMGSMGGGGAIEVVGKILGSDIILASNRAKQNLNFIG